MCNRNIKFILFRRIISLFITILFLCSVLFPPSVAQAQSVLGLPTPGTMVTPTASFIPAVMKGIKIFPDNPLRFDFIIDTGHTKFQDAKFEAEASKLIKYFLASLTIPEDELWVNLSPYEKDRIIPDKFGTTGMGRDLLGQDYVLKQLTASLIYPEDDLGKEFWGRVYAKANALYGTTDIPVNTFNKVWVAPQSATVYENGDVAFIVDSRLKVMLESDYLSLKENKGNEKFGVARMAAEDVSQISDVSSQIIREVILPEIEKEVNGGEHFTALRQIYHSMVMATWFKRNLKENLLGRIYVDKNKISGVDIDDKQMKEKIYQQYLKAFKRGVYSYIKKEYDADTRQMIPRKYFSGGFKFDDKAMMGAVKVEQRDRAALGDAAKRTTKGLLKTASTFFKTVRAAVTPFDTAPSEDNDQAALGDADEVVEPDQARKDVIVGASVIEIEEIQGGRRTKIADIIKSIFKYGLVSEQKAGEVEIDLFQGVDKNNMNTKGVTVVADEIPSFKTFLSKNKFIHYPTNISGYKDFIKGRAYVLLKGNRTNSPLEILGERNDSNINNEVRKVGKDVVEERLKSGIMILMSTPTKINELKKENLSQEDINIFGFSKLNVNLIEAIFAPSNVFSLVKKNVPDIFKNKVINVKGSILAEKYKQPVNLAHLSVLRIPDWQNALIKYLKIAKKDRTFMMHAVRFPTIEDIKTAKDNAMLNDSGVSASSGSKETKSREEIYKPRLMEGLPLFDDVRQMAWRMGWRSFRLKDWLSDSDLKDLLDDFHSDRDSIAIALSALPRTAALGYGFFEKAGNEVDINQFDLVVRDFEKIIEMRKERNQEITIYQIGLSLDEKFPETREIFEAVKKAFEANGVSEKDQASWQVNFVAVDVNAEVVENFFNVLKTKAFFKINFELVKADTVIEGQMRLLGERYKADYIFHRNTTYANQHASQGNLQIKTDEPLNKLSKLSIILNVYLSTKNILKHLTQKGTKYIVEPAQRNENSFVLRLPGTHIVRVDDYTPVETSGGDAFDNIGTGIYQVVDPVQMFQKGIKFFLSQVSSPIVDSQKNVIVGASGAEASERMDDNAQLAALKQKAIASAKELLWKSNYGFGTSPGVTAIHPAQRYAVVAFPGFSYTYDYAGSIVNSAVGPSLIWVDLEGNTQKFLKQNYRHNAPNYFEAIFHPNNNQLIVVDEINRAFLWDITRPQEPAEMPLSDDLEKAYRPNYILPDDLKMGDYFDEDRIDQKEVHSRRVLKWREHEVIICGDKTFVVWKRGPRKGKIYKILDNPADVAVKGLSSKFREILKTIDGYIRRMEDSFDREEGDNQAQAWKEAHVYLRKMDRGNKDFIGFRTGRYYNDEIYSFMEDVEKGGINNWLSRRAELLGYVDSEIYTNNIRRNEKVLDFYAGAPANSREPYVDADDPVVLTHYTYDVVLSDVIQLRGLGSANHIASYGIKLKSGERAGYSPDRVSFFYYSGGQVSAELGFGQPKAFELPMIFGVSKSKEESFQYTYDSADEYTEYLDMDQSVAGIQNEKGVNKFVPLEDITHVFVPYFIVAETTGIFKEQGCHHIKVLPLGFDKNQRPIKMDSAMMANVQGENPFQKNNPGGIDLNEEFLNLQRQGRGLDFEMPFNSQNIETIPIDGLSPVIFQIIPTNLPLLLGISEKDEEPGQLTSLR